MANSTSLLDIIRAVMHRCVRLATNFFKKISRPRPEDTPHPQCNAGLETKPDFVQKLQCEERLGVENNPEPENKPKLEEGLAPEKKAEVEEQPELENNLEEEDKVQVESNSEAERNPEVQRSTEVESNSEVESNPEVERNPEIENKSAVENKTEAEKKPAVEQKPVVEKKYEIEKKLDDKKKLEVEDYLEAEDKVQLEDNQELVNKPQAESTPEVKLPHPVVTTDDPVASTASEQGSSKKPSGVAFLIQAYEKRMSLAASSNCDTVLPEKKKSPAKKKMGLGLLSVLSAGRGKLKDASLALVSRISEAAAALTETARPDDGQEVSRIPQLSK